MRKIKRKKTKKTYLIIAIIFLLGLFSLTGYKIYRDKLNEITLEHKENTIKEIKSHYSDKVTIKKNSKIYELINNEYKDVGEIYIDKEITLDNNLKIDENTKYFKTNFFDKNKDYYVFYKDVMISDNKEESKENSRIKSYIPFNINIKSKDSYTLYNDNDNKLYRLSNVIDSPIIIKKEDKYGFIYNEELVYIKKEDVEKTYDNKNTDNKNTSGIAVLNYHFFYDENNQEERRQCNQEICHSLKQFREQLEYLKNNNFFTPTLAEFEQYLSGEIQLPKSVVITIDDGWLSGGGVNLLNEYKMNGTVFLITKSYDPVWTRSEYVEVHSHSDNLHRNYVCNKGKQGGALICEDDNSILADLKKSRDKLDGSKYFCYPFYDYDKHSVDLVKEAGFTMAFAGGEYRKATVGIDKMYVPRYVIGTWTTINKFVNYVN